MLEKRAQKEAQLDAEVKSMLAAMPGRVPGWERRRVMLIDRYCLEEGKRCIMWDDDGAGFYLVRAGGREAGAGERAWPPVCSLSC